MSGVVTARLYDIDGTTLIPNALDASWDRWFGDPLSDVGRGGLTIAFADPYADEVRRDRIVKILVDGVERFAFKIDVDPELAQVAVGEEIDQVLRVQGASWASVLDEAVVWPDFDTAIELDATWRVMSFASPDFPNAGSWANAVELYEYRDGVTEDLRVVITTDSTGAETVLPAPQGFLWPNSPKNGNGVAPTPTYSPTYWIWPAATLENAVGYAFFITDFTLADDQPVTFTPSADNLYTFFFEGQPILGEKVDLFAWQGFKEHTIMLPPGTYRIAAVVRNVDAPNLTFNPGGFIAAGPVLASDGEAAAVPWVSAFATNATWKAYFHATTWPGWTPGQIIEKLLVEAEARGALAAVTVARSFAALTDSAGNDYDSLDTETSSPYVPVFSIQNGRTLIDVLGKLRDDGWIDWHVRPDTCTLDVWAAGSLAGASAATFVAGVNIRSLERGAATVYANALLVQWDGGLTSVADAAAITARGTRVEDIYATDAETKAEAERRGRVELQRRAVEARAATVIEIDSSSVDVQPYVDFQLGNNVTVPDAFGGTVVQPVVSITMTEVDGFAMWRCELNRRWLNPDRMANDLIRTIGGKVMASPGVAD